MKKKLEHKSNHGFNNWKQEKLYEDLKIKELDENFLVTSASRMIQLLQNSAYVYKHTYMYIFERWCKIT